jgi:hypothetical protein
MLKRFATISIGLLALTITGCDLDPMAGTPTPPESAKSADWNAYRNCRERLSYAQTNGEIDADRLAERIRIECENGFAPVPVDAGGPSLLTQEAGTLGAPSQAAGGSGR